MRTMLAAKAGGAASALEVALKQGVHVRGGSDGGGGALGRVTLTAKRRQALRAGARHWRFAR